VIVQLPVATEAVQVSPVASLNVTFPVGVPLPGETGTTVNVKVTDWPATEGLGEPAVIVVFVFASFTVCVTLADVLEAKLESPL